MTQISGRDIASRSAFALAAGLAMAVASLDAARAEPGWDRVRTPAKGPSQAIGYYTNGCLAGGRRLPLKGAGFQVIRPQRNRYWGHPRMIAFVRRLAQYSQATFGRTLLIADIAQPRGGPITGHASHEVGLDADIRLLLVKPEEISQADIVTPPQVSMLVPDRSAIDRNRWSSRQLRLIRRAARDPEVDRIFVNPIIKAELCRSVKRDRGWLAKVVPWWGHDAHMHVRIHCPKGSPDCRPQKAIDPADDGCGKPLNWWLETALPAARKWREKQKLLKKEKKRESGVKKPESTAGLPKACAAILNGN